MTRTHRVFRFSPLSQPARWLWVLVWMWSHAAMAIEEPPYQVLQQDGAFEIRHYAPQLVAQTWVEGDMEIGRAHV